MSSLLAFERNPPSVNSEGSVSLTDCSLKEQPEKVIGFGISLNISLNYIHDSLKRTSSEESFFMNRTTLNLLHDFGFYSLNRNDALGVTCVM